MCVCVAVVQEPMCVLMIVCTCVFMCVQVMASGETRFLAGEATSVPLKSLISLMWAGLNCHLQLRDDHNPHTLPLPPASGEHYFSEAQTQNSSSTSDNLCIRGCTNSGNLSWCVLPDGGKDCTGCLLTDFNNFR